MQGRALYAVFENFRAKAEPTHFRPKDWGVLIFHEGKGKAESFLPSS